MSRLYSVKNQLRNCIARALYLGIRTEPKCFFNDDIMKKAEKRILLLEKPLDGRLRLIFQYPSYLIKQEMINNKNNTIPDQWVKSFRDSSERRKMLLIGLAFYSGMIDNRISREIMSFAYDCKNDNYRYWITQNISKFCFLLQNGIYDNYYNDRKKLVKKCAEDLHICLPTRKSNCKSDSLCIVTYLQSDRELNSMQRVSTMVANGLSKYFRSVNVIVLDCFQVGKNDDHSICSAFRYPSLSKNISVIKKMYNENVNLHFCSGNNYSERFQNAIDLIYELNPKAIIDLSDEYSIISYFYQKDFFTLCMPIRVGASSLFFDAIEGVAWKMELLNNKYSFLQDEIVIDWCFPEYVPKEEKSLQRSDYGIDEDRFICLSLGRCTGVNTYEFLDEMCSFLINNKDATWLIVGDSIPLYVSEKYPELLVDQIKSKPFESHICSLCSFCDVLVRLDTTGGSGSTAIAAMHGLPIVMTDYTCDPMRWLGRDYSSNHNYKEEIEYLQLLKNDKNLYKEKQIEVRKLVEEATDADKKWESLYLEIERQISLKQSRL